MTRPRQHRHQGRNRTIPFTDEMADAIRAGRKTATTRTKKYGEPGDVLTTPAGPIVLETVGKVPMSEAAAMFREEGFESREAFIGIWKRLHPRVGYVPTQRVYVHRFHRLADEGKGLLGRRVEA
jgi:hypothetical protein